MTLADAAPSPVDEARRRALMVLPRSVRTLMKAHDVTGKQLAAALHMSAGSLSERLSGEVRFSADEVAGIAAFFELPTGVLFTDPRETLKTRSEKSERRLTLASSRPNPDRRYKSKGSPLLATT